MKLFIRWFWHPYLFQKQIAAILISLAGSTIAYAGPGAHGPNGEHLNAPAAGHAQGSAGPRVEAKSEMFELVGRLDGGQFTLFIDKFATNEPVLAANVEVETGNTRAKAAFRADQGDYIVTDPAMLKLLAGPTKQAMVFTIAAGADTDLLDGALIPASGAGGQSAAHNAVGDAGWRYAGAATVIVVTVLAWLFWRRRQYGRFPHSMRGGAK